MTTRQTEETEALRLVMSHRPMLKSFVRILVRDRDLAEEALTDACVAILASYGQYDRRSPFIPWARAIARNVARTKVRAAKREHPLLDAENIEGMADDVEDIETEPGVALRREALDSCLEKLPPRHRRLIRLRYFDKRPYDDMSRLAGKTVGALYAVFSRLHSSLGLCIVRTMEKL